ncbi:glycoside hydrolase family 17 protein [Cristinia sonorae]|uniref:glucan endo-1,3-beta-D-glucosidase n=1 Tax=Cristinia sonorae TaxID=1940300 RepID=A0A8K0UYP2_9AGAR|nr:glycoside hydrolase family 17 protein [Cristinia sonorae]
MLQALIFLAAALLAHSTPVDYDLLIFPYVDPVPYPTPTAPSCFPAMDFTMPATVPNDSDLAHWWCDPQIEYAFMGFSYEVTECQSAAKLNAEFADMRRRFNSRYFGFDGDDLWKSRRDKLLSTLHNNPKAPFVTRGVQFGSEPLFDGVLSHQELTQQVVAAKADLANLYIPVTVSEMAYGFQKHGGAQDVLDAIDFVNIHMLPFFSQSASTAVDSWPIVQGDLHWFMQRTNGKKMYLDENGWPSVSYEGVEPNSPKAVADIENERNYYALLDQHCEELKSLPAGGVGWFAHIYSDSQEPGYGIYDEDGQLKFPFSPRTSC